MKVIWASPPDDGTIENDQLVERLPVEESLSESERAVWAAKLDERARDFGASVMAIRHTGRWMLVQRPGPGIILNDAALVSIEDVLNRSVVHLTQQVGALSNASAPRA